jgi:hypothetical protein
MPTLSEHQNEVDVLASEYPIGSKVLVRPGGNSAYVGTTVPYFEYRGISESSYKAVAGSVFKIFSSFVTVRNDETGLIDALPPERIVLIPDSNTNQTSILKEIKTIRSSLDRLEALLNG